MESVQTEADAERLRREAGEREDEAVAPIEVIASKIEPNLLGLITWDMHKLTHKIRHNHHEDLYLEAAGGLSRSLPDISHEFVVIAPREIALADARGSRGRGRLCLVLVMVRPS